MDFPGLRTRDLEGNDRLVPSELDGELQVVMIAFQRWHTALIETWLPLLRALQSRHEGLTVWEVPALSRMYAAGRFYIDGGMRMGIPDPEDRRHTLTAYTDLHSLRDALDMSSQDDIYLFALDRSGTVLWRARGALEEASAEALVALADRVLGTGADAR